MEKNEKEKFDFEEFARQAEKQFRDGKAFTGEDGVFTSLLHRILEDSLPRYLSNLFKSICGNIILKDSGCIMYP
jgi:hypothetical protein